MGRDNAGGKGGKSVLKKEQPMQRPRAEREGREFENVLVSSQNGLFGTGGVWESC